MESASTTTALDTPLAAAHQRAGAKLGVWFGCTLPDDFGDPVAEYRAARDTVALIDKNYRAILYFAGPDRVRYLNAILTNNIKDLSPGQGNVSLLLNPQGHILAEIETHAFADKLLCVSYAMIRERLIEWLDKYIIMDDVTLTDESHLHGTLALEGPHAAAVVRELSAIDIAQLAELSSTEAIVASISCRIVKRSLGKTAGAEFIVARKDLARLWQLLAEAAQKHGGGAMGYTALNALRLEQGIPWFAYDFGEKQIPHEAGLQDSHISYTKGCYTGQEIVERVRSRGQVNRVRVLLKSSSAEILPVGTTLLAEEKEAGYITRAAFSPALNVGIAMGYVRREKSAIGTELHLDGRVITVIPSPLD